jgi:acetate kinase
MIDRMRPSTRSVIRSMKILVLNCGSSSAKFQLMETTGEEVLARGIVEKIGSTGAFLRYKRGQAKEIKEIVDAENHDAAISLILSTLMHPRDGVMRSADEIDGIGHRVVHGGEQFTESALVTPRVRNAIEWCCRFAPLHNPHNLRGIDVCTRLMPGRPQVVVFDTAFHQTMPAENFLYPLPYGLYRMLGVRRYGFHGTSHRYVAQRAAEELGRPLDRLGLITCHLGNGASVAAIRNGASVDTSMGFTPLEGLMMGTRTGDLDPAVIPYLMQSERMSPSDVDTLLNKRSGLLGVTETSNDMREVIERMTAGSERHRLAFKMFCHRVRKYIGSYAAVLGGVDAVVFTGGIGENSSQVRAECLRDLGFLGIELDIEANGRNATRLSRGKTQALVIPTNEELAIARDTKAVLDGTSAVPSAAQAAEGIDRELASLARQDVQELVLMWAAEPAAPIDTLRDRLVHKVGKPLSVAALKRELERLGLEGADGEAGAAGGPPAGKVAR